MALWWVPHTHTHTDFCSLPNQRVTIVSLPHIFSAFHHPPFPPTSPCTHRISGRTQAMRSTRCGRACGQVVFSCIISAPPSSTMGASARPTTWTALRVSKPRQRPSGVHWRSVELLCAWMRHLPQSALPAHFSPRLYGAGAMVSRSTRRRPPAASKRSCVYEYGSDTHGVSAEKCTLRRQGEQWTWRECGEQCTRWCA